MKKMVSAATSLLDFLFVMYPDTSRSAVKKILGSGTVLVNGRASTLFNQTLKSGDVVEIDAKLKPLRYPAPYPILLEDPDFVVVDKPVGIVTSSDDGTVSVYKTLSDWYRNRSKGLQRAFVVHRLDKEVSGVLLFARSQDAMERITGRWKEAKKVYTALVEGKPKQSKGEIRSWLLEDKSQKMHSVAEGTELAKEAISHYKVLKNLKTHTLVEITLETGRKNQIRVHMSDIGCPIVGDRKYGADETYKRRIRLHATTLTFPHPQSGIMVQAKSSLPSIFLELKNGDENYK